MRKRLLNSWQNSHGLFNVDFRYFGNMYSHLFNKPLLITSLSSVGGNRTKIKRHHCQQVEQLDIYIYIIISALLFFRTLLFFKATQLQPQSQCYFYLTYNLYLVAISNFIFCPLCLFIYDCFIHLNMLVVGCGDLHNM